MSRSALDSILRLLAPGEEPIETPTEKAVMYDPDRHRVIDRRPLMPWAAKRTRYYLVTVGKAVRYSAKRLRLESGNGTNGLDVEVNCHIGCPEGQQQKLVAALAAESNPKSTFDNIIADAAAAFENEEILTRGRDPVLSFFEVRDAWQDFIADTIEKQTGLKAKVKLDAEGDLGPIEFNENLRVHVKDFNDRLSMTVQVVLEVLDDRKKEAILSIGRSSALRDEVRRKICNAIPKNYGIQEFCTKADKIRADLRELINETVEPYGREVGFLKVETQSPHEMPETSMVEFRHPCKIRNYDKDIEISHTVLLELVDVASFWKSQIQDFRVWLSQKLEELTRAELIECDYNTVATKFDTEVQPRLRTALETEVRKAGFNVKKFIGGADIQEAPRTSVELKETIPVYTSDCDEQLSVAIQLIMEIPEKWKIKAVVSAGQKKSLRELIVDAVRQFISQQCKLHEFCKNRETVEGSLRQILEEAAATYGREVVNCKIELRAPFSPPDPVYLEHNSSCKIRNWDHEIVVQHTVRVELEDLGFYRRSKPSDVAQWIQNNLDSISRAELLNYDYRGVVTDFESQLQPTIKKLFEDALRRIGFRLKNYETALVLNKRPIEAEEFHETIPVYAHDCERELTIQFHGRFDVPEANHKSALLSAARPTTLKDSFAEAIRIQAKTFGISSFCLKPEEVKSELLKTINEVASNYGRRTIHCKLELVTPFRLPDLNIIEHQHFCKIKDWQQDIEVHHKVFLQVLDVAKFLRSGLHDAGEIRNWLQERVTKVAQSVLFQCDFVKIVMDFDSELQQKIREQVETDATARGFAIRQFSSAPNVEAKRLQRDGFRIDLKDEEFKTKDSRVTAKLTIVLRGRVDNLEKLRPYLNPSTRIEESIAVTARQTAEDLLHKTPPEVFYLQFRNLEEDEEQKDSQAGTTVESQIVKEVACALADKFGATCDQITVKQSDSALTKRHSALTNARPRFRVLCKSTDGCDIEFEVAFRILGVDSVNWFAFQNGGFHKAGEPDVETEIRDIAKYVQDGVTQRLNHSFPMRALQFDNSAHRERLKTAIFAGIKGMYGDTPIDMPGIVDAVKQHYGLVIEPTFFGREDALHEKLAREITQQELAATSKYRLDRRQHELRKLEALEAKELEITKASPEEEELAVIQKQKLQIGDRLEGSMQLKEHTQARDLPKIAPPKGNAPDIVLEFVLGTQREALPAPDSGDKKQNIDKPTDKSK